MAKASKGTKFAGRPVGSPNKKSQYPRDEKFKQFRCSQGFTQTVEALKRELSCSGADVMHDALQLYAFKKLKDSEDILWANKIQ
jgi:hypothetical protein